MILAVHRSGVKWDAGFAVFVFVFVNVAGFDVGFVLCDAGILYRTGQLMGNEKMTVAEMGRRTYTRRKVRGPLEDIRVCRGRFVLGGCHWMCFQSPFRDGLDR